MLMKKFAILAVCASFGLAACQTQDPYTGEQKTSKATYGALIGAVGGALAGGLIGKGDARDRRERAAPAGVDEILEQATMFTLLVQALGAQPADAGSN